MSFTIILGVTGLAGDDRAATVIAELGRLDGVVDVVVDLTSSTVEVTSRRELDRAVVEEAVGASHLAVTTTPIPLAVA